MRTDRLIDLLSSDLEAVSQGRVAQTVRWAAIVGGAVGICLMLVTLPLREFDGVDDARFFALKVAFALSLVGMGLQVLVRSAQPGRSVTRLLTLLSVPFLTLAALSIAVVVTAPTAQWRTLLVGAQSALCLVCIPLFAVPPFVALTWALRGGAPTDLPRTGAVLGLVAGALGAIAYAFSCMDDALPFVALWYSGAIALCAAVGARLGPRLLHW